MECYEQKKSKLKKLMEEYASEDLIVAFSGGVDSGLLLKMACEAVKSTGRTVYGIMLHTMLHPVSEVESAGQAAQDAGADFMVLKIDELRGAGIEDNPPDRCYRCKSFLFQAVLKEAQKLGVRTILEGTNADDLHMYRPGIRAVRELGIASPLADAGLKKEEVRRLAGEYNISLAEKPSAPCLATRFPYGAKLSDQDMRRVEAGEACLKDFGFYNVRLRVHGDLARIEVDGDAMLTVMEHKEEITACLRKLGYAYITLDLEGFRSGSMDYAAAD